MNRIKVLLFMLILIGCKDTIEEDTPINLVGTSWSSFAFTMSNSKIEAYYTIDFISDKNFNLNIKTKQQFVISIIPELTYHYSFPQIMMDLPESTLNGVVRDNTIDFDGFIFTKL